MTTQQKRTTVVGKTATGKTAATKQAVTTAKQQGRKVSVVDPKNKRAPQKAGKSRVPYSNQYGSFDGTTFRKRKVKS